METITLSPALLTAFCKTIKHLKGAPATPENIEEGRAIIDHYTGRLQLLNLDLSQQDARDILAQAYRTI
jgi:hypothetical protein